MLLKDVEKLFGQEPQGHRHLLSSPNDLHGRKVFINNPKKKKNKKMYTNTEMGRKNGHLGFITTPASIYQHLHTKLGKLIILSAKLKIHKKITITRIQMQFLLIDSWDNRLSIEYTC